MAEIVLQVEGLTKRYGPLVAVDHLSLSVMRGEVFGLLGPNGAGKTTSISMMCGLLRPDEGRVLIDGKAVTGGDARLRARIGVCPQDILLWSHLTCIEQLEFVGVMYGVAGREARKRGDQLLDELGLSEKRNSQAHTLSGGMQRRLNLAMALVHDPDIVVLDEPEAGLDPQSRVAVREYIRRLAATKTIILTTHNMDEADRLAGRVAIVDHGTLLTLDTPENLKRSTGQGDVLEIRLARGRDLGVGDISSGLVDPDCRDAALAALASLGLDTRFNAADGSLHVRALDMVNMLPDIVERLRGAGIATGEIRLRENTLEDVFIQLTGRRLRE